MAVREVSLSVQAARAGLKAGWRLAAFGLLIVLFASSCGPPPIKDARVAKEWARHRAVVAEAVFTPGDQRPFYAVQFFRDLTGVPIDLTNNWEVFYITYHEQVLKELDRWLSQNHRTLAWDEACQCVVSR